ncbi:hypothetical protein [Streptomyces sp. Ru62]|nr:hypothetical protein [Streptomyces sp. Ru62]
MPSTTSSSSSRAVLHCPLCEDPALLPAVEHPALLNLGTLNAGSFAVER